MLRLNLVSSLGGHDRRRRRTLLIRFAILSFSAFFIAQVVPTLADETQNAVELTSEIAPVENPSVEETPTASTSPSPQPKSETGTSPSSPPPSLAPPKAIDSQGMKIQITSKVSVDPRAQVVRIPAVTVSGPEFLLVCIQSQASVLDILTKGVPNDVNANNLFILGDLTSTLIVAGPTSLFNSAFNTQGGAKLSSLGGFLSNRIVELAFIATDKLADNAALCSSVAPGNRRVIVVSPLSLGLELKKGEIRLKN